MNEGPSPGRGTSLGNTCRSKWAPATSSKKQGGAANDLPVRRRRTTPRPPVRLPTALPARAAPWMGVWAWLLKWLAVLMEPRGLGALGVTRMRSRSRSPKRSGNALVWSSSFCRCPAENWGAGGGEARQQLVPENLRGTEMPHSAWRGGAVLPYTSAGTILRLLPTSFLRFPRDLVHRERSLWAAWGCRDGPPHPYLLEQAYVLFYLARLTPTCWSRHTCSST